MDQTQKKVYMDCVANELGQKRYYDKEKYMMLLRSIPNEVLKEWITKYIYNDEEPESESESEECV